jgi:hypothetical protein
MKIADEITRYFHSKNNSYEKTKSPSLHSGEFSTDSRSANVRRFSNISYTTMRNMPYDTSLPPQKMENLKKVYSYMQLYATYYMLGNINSAFTPMFAIQISSFLMTLVKKNIINPMLWHPLYFFSLLTNTFAFYTLTPIFIIKMNIACSWFTYWRMKLGYNKYLGWLIVFAFHYFCLFYLENPVWKNLQSTMKENEGFRRSEAEVNTYFPDLVKENTNFQNGSILSSEKILYYWFSFLFQTGDKMALSMRFIMKLVILYHLFKYSPV